MMNEAVKSRPKFERVEDATSQAQLFALCGHELSSAMIWIDDQGQSISTHVRAFRGDEGVLVLNQPKDFDAFKLQAELNQRELTECYVSISAPRALLFFKATPAGLEEGSLLLNRPKDLYIVHRRNNERIPVPEGYLIKCEFVDPIEEGRMHSKRVVDLSVGGVSVEIEAKENSYFVPDLTIPLASIIMNGMTIRTTLEVRHITPNRSVRGKLKSVMGLEFKNLTPQQLEFLKDYIDQESRRHFMSFTKTPA